MTILSMSHDQIVFYAMLGKHYSKGCVTETNRSITFSLTSLIRDIASLYKVGDIASLKPNKGRLHSCDSEPGELFKI